MSIVNRPLRVMHIISGDLWAGAEVQAFTLIKYLKPQVNLHIVVMNSGELSNRLHQLGVELTIVPENELNSMAIIGRLKRLISAFNPDVIHTHRQKENILGNLANVLASPLSHKRAKSVRTSHGAPEFKPSYRQKIQVFIDQWVGKHLQQAVIAVSTELAEKLRAIFPKTHLHIIHNGVDQAALRQQVKDADFRLAAPNKIHIGIIGRLEPVKRVDIFIAMAALAHNDQTLPHALQFHVIGDGRLKTTLQAQAENLGLQNHLVFHGHRSDMAACIHSLDAIVMCSDHEGTPMTALEATALGTPLIAHNVGGLAEVLQELPELLVNDHTASGYYACLKRLLTTDSKTIALKPEYTAEYNRDATLNLYHSVTHNR